jgi:phage gpG-like protein
MSQFPSLGAFALHLATQHIQEQKSLERGLEKVAKLIEKSAKSQFGTYQRGTGPFEKWPPLAESTQEDRVQHGFSADEPLLRTGELRDSISHQVQGLRAVIGSTSDVMVYQELGTSKIPPRPVLGPAAIRRKKAIKKILGDAAVEGLLPHGVKAPNYDNMV